MTKWNQDLVDYNSAAFHEGFEDGSKGIEADPGSRNGEDYASYMEGWLTGQAEMGWTERGETI